MGKFNGKVVMITGGAQGIGRAIAEAFLDQAAKVVIIDQDAEAGEEAESELGSAVDVAFFQADVAQEQQVMEAVEYVIERFGFLDILINNAAISNRKPLTELSFDEWQRVLHVNLSGTFLCAKHSYGQLKENRGCIVNIASTRALMSEPQTEAYSASKGGVVALTHAMAASMAPDVRVNCISPGWVDVSGWKKTSQRRAAELTDGDHAQHWSGRVGIPQDIAAMALFLCSVDAGFITGANYVVDGGMTRKMIYLE